LVVSRSTIGNAAGSRLVAAERSKGHPIVGAREHLDFV
jgi:hypothetical protein